MVDAEPDEEMKRWIAAFVENGKKNDALGNTEVIMIFRNTCGLCHMQFRNFINYYGITFDEKMNNENKKLIADKILPLEYDTDQFAKDLVREASKWSKITGLARNKIERTPVWLDIETHEMYAQGVMRAGNMLVEDLLNPKALKSKRKEFNILYSKIMGEECKEVLCTLPGKKASDPYRESVPTNGGNGNKEKAKKFVCKKCKPNREFDSERGFNIHNSMVHKK